jgi:hypothetical protein
LIYVIDSNPTDGSVKSKKVTVGDLIDSRIYGISSSQFVLITGYYADPSWITSLDWSKITNAPSFVTSLSALTDVQLSTPLPGQALIYNGTKWVNQGIGELDTLNSVTTRGNTTTNAITVGGLVVDTNTLVVDSVNNKVGIGTTTPFTNLDVVGPSGRTTFTGNSRLGLTIRGSVNQEEYNGIDFVGGSGTTNPIGRVAMKSTNSGSVLEFGTSASFATGITKTFTFDFLGRLAVDIGAQSLNGYAALFGDASNFGYYYIGLKATATDLYMGQSAGAPFALASPSATILSNLGSVFSIGTFNIAAFVLGTSNVERARFTAGGNLLIGTTTDAGYKLDVNGSLRTTGILYSNNNLAVGNYDPVISPSGSVNLSVYSNVVGTPGRIAVGGYATAGPSLNGIISFVNTQLNNYPGQFEQAKIESYFAPNYETGGDLRFYTRTYSYLSERLRITDSGNILINTTTDSGFRLAVNGTARIVGATRIDNLSGTGTRMVVADASGVMSTQALGISGSIATGQVAFGTGAGVVGGDNGLVWDNVNKSLVIRRTTVGIVLDVFAENTANVFTISNLGSTFRNVGSNPSLVANEFRVFSNTVAIGTGSPILNTMLGIQGTALRTWLLVARTFLSQPIFAISQNTGNVLIGTETDAGYRLDVLGTTRTLASVENVFRVEHTNGNYATIEIGAGGNYAAGDVVMTRNNTVIFTTNGGYFQLGAGNVAVRSPNTTFQVLGGFGAATLGTSVRLASYTINQGVFTATSGIQNTVVVGDGTNERWQPSSGNATYNLFSVVPVINTTGTYAGIVRGIYYNPTLTSITGVTHRAIETTSGNVIFNGGNVGIGTSTPTYNLEVSSTTGTELGIVSGANTIAQIDFRNRGYGLPRWTIRAGGAPDGSSGNLTFQRLGSTFPLTITSGDNVLIGFGTDAGYKLDVNGIARVGAAGSSGQLYIKGFAGAGQYIYLDDGATVWSLVGGGNYGIQENGTTRFTVRAGNGNVGIGTATPTSKLFIYTDNTSSTIGDNNAFIIHNNNPNWATSGAGNLTELFFSDAGQGSGTTNGLNLNHRYAGISAFLTGWNGISSAGGLNFITKENTASTLDIKLQIKPNGNVLIGTTTDSGYKLDVNGTFRSTGETILASTSGNVGIGTTAPLAKLQVKSSITNGVGTEAIRAYGTSNYIGIHYDEGRGPVLTTNYSGVGGTSPGAFNFYTASVLLASIGTGGIYSHNINGKISAGNAGGYINLWNGASGNMELVTTSNHNMTFSTNNTERVRINNSGSVGIGTDNPVYKFDVRGQGYFATVSNTNQLTLGDTTNGTIAAISQTNENISFITGASSTRMFISSSGNVGIGTTSPSYKLDVYGSPRFYGDGNHMYTRIFSGATNKDSKILFGNDAERFNVGLAASSNTFAINSSNGGTPTSLNIDYTTGNVGIGTSSPTGSLDIQKNSATAVRIGDAGAYPILFNFNTQTGDLSTFSRIRSLSSQPIILSPMGTDAVTINTSGNVGIGTSTPAYKLQVGGGDIAIDYNRYLRGGGGGDWNLVNLYNAGTGDIEITMLNVGWYLRHNANATFAGNVGIGTTIPSAKLDVSTALNGVIGIFQSSVSTAIVQVSAVYENKFRAGSNSDNSEFWYDGGYATTYIDNNCPNTGASFNQYGDIRFRRKLDGTNLSTVMTIRGNDGDVGIGTTTPAAKLDVQGNINIGVSGATTVTTYYNSTTRNQIIYTNNSSFEFIEGANERMRLVAGSGNLLIGTSTDSGYKLDVNGSVRIVSSLLVDTFGTNNAATLGGVLQLNSSITVLNKAQTAWIPFATRNQTGSEVVYDLSNIGSISAKGLSPGLFSQTSDSVAVTNTTVESSLISTGVGTLSVPANGFQVGAAYIAYFSGVMSSQNNATMEIHLRSNGFVLANTDPMILSATTGKFWELHVNFVIRAIGGGGVAAIVTSGRFSYNKDSGNTPESLGFSDVNNTTFDTTINNTLAVTATWGNASPSNSIQTRIFNLYRVY